ncbi:MAG: M48 family metallopeptidase [Elusimicrobiota bacterium]
MTAACRILPLLFLLAACAKVPVTGRRALSLVPDGQVSAMASDAYKDLLKNSKLSGDAEATEMLRRVGRRIAEVSNRPDFQWEFNLIEDDKTVNAFCMPGGKVAFYTGILPVCAGEAGVAAVMGHEVAHAIAKHGGERLSQQLLLTFGEVSLDYALREKPAQTRQMAQMAFGVGAGVGYILPYGRMQESEADRIGLIYMARAGYDPREAVRFWERMAAGSGGQPPEFLSTHPSHGRRVADLKSWMDEALKEYEKSPYRKP